MLNDAGESCLFYFGSSLAAVFIVIRLLYPITNKVGCLSNFRALGSVCVRLRLARKCRPDVTSGTALRKNTPLTIHPRFRQPAIIRNEI
jgi:hypothetical protein